MQISIHEEKQAVCHTLHNYVSAFGFAEGVKRFTENHKQQIKIAN